MAEGARVITYAERRVWASAAQLGRLDNSAKLLQKLNVSTWQALNRLNRDPLRQFHRKHLCNQLDDLARSIVTVLRTRQSLLEACTDERPDEVVVTLGCEHRVQNNEEDLDGDRVFAYSAWRDQIETLLKLTDSAADRLMNSCGTHFQYLRSVTKIAHALQRQQRHVELFQPKKQPNIRVETPACAICDSENGQTSM